MKTTVAQRRLQAFIRSWQEALWGAMQTTGKGYRKYSLKNTGRGMERTQDKLEHPGESKLQRKARLGQLGVRRGW